MGDEQTRHHYHYAGMTLDNRWVLHADRPCHNDDCPEYTRIDEMDCDCDRIGGNE